MATVDLQAEFRTVVGKEGAKKLRQVKRIPAVVYGGPRGPIPVVVKVYNDRSFEFVTKSPPAAALLKQALNDYQDVFLGNVLRDGEPSDPFWVKKAGMEAARLAESLTIAWMVVELIVALWAGIAAHSVALTTFGIDSAIEFFTALDSMDFGVAEGGVGVAAADCADAGPSPAAFTAVTW